MKNLVFVLSIIISGANVYAAEGGKSIVKVNGMVCAFCATSIEKKFNKLDEVSGIEVDLDSKVVTINYKEGKSLPEEQIRKIITESGYAISSIESSK